MQRVHLMNAAVADFDMPQYLAHGEVFLGAFDKEREVRRRLDGHRSGRGAACGMRSKEPAGWPRLAAEAFAAAA